jgi:hypothetical protein
MNTPAMERRSAVQVKLKAGARVATWETADDYATEYLPFAKTQIIQGLAKRHECIAVMRSGIIVPCKAGDWRFA